jgi:hypothetical protein
MSSTMTKTKTTLKRKKTRKSDGTRIQAIPF